MNPWKQLERCMRRFARVEQMIEAPEREAALNSAMDDILKAEFTLSCSKGTAHGVSVGNDDEPNAVFIDVHDLQADSPTMGIVQLSHLRELVRKADALGIPNEINLAVNPTPEQLDRHLATQSPARN